MISILTYYFSFINTNINEGGDGKTCQVFKCTANIHILSDMDWFVSTSLKISNRYILRSQVKYSSFGTQVSATLLFTNKSSVIGITSLLVHYPTRILIHIYIYIYMHLHAFTYVDILFIYIYL